MTKPKNEASTVTSPRPWVSPEVRTLRAGSAEAGANPNFPEGGIARGS